MKHEPISLRLLCHVTRRLSGRRVGALRVRLGSGRVVSRDSCSKAGRNTQRLCTKFQLRSSIEGGTKRSVASRSLCCSGRRFTRFVRSTTIVNIRIIPRVSAPTRDLTLAGMFPGLKLSNGPRDISRLSLSGPTTRGLTRAV